MMSSDDSGHTQLKCKCVSCGLHFIILTWEPETHKAESIVCPECGVKRYPTDRVASAPLEYTLMLL